MSATTLSGGPWASPPVATIPIRVAFEYLPGAWTDVTPMQWIDLTYPKDPRRRVAEAVGWHLWVALMRLSALADEIAHA